MIKRFLSQYRAFRGDDQGTSTLEFLMVFPIFCFLIMAAYEVGHFTTVSAMLDRGLDQAVRDVRIGRNPDVTLSSLRSATCQYSRRIRNCEERLHIQLQPIEARGFVAPAQVASCIDVTTGLAPLNEFVDGGANELMLVRACVVVDPVFPSAILGAGVTQNADSTYSIVTTSAFVNEPNT